MTFVDEVQDKPIAVGFYVNRKGYAHLQNLANALYKQMIDDGHGAKAHAIQQPTITDYIKFCVQFFEQNMTTYDDFMKNPKLAAMLQQMVGALMGGTKQ